MHLYRPANSKTLSIGRQNEKRSTFKRYERVLSSLGRYCRSRRMIAAFMTGILALLLMCRASRAAFAHVSELAVEPGCRAAAPYADGALTFVETCMNDEQDARNELANELVPSRCARRCNASHVNVGRYSESAARAVTESFKKGSGGRSSGALIAEEFLASRPFSARRRTVARSHSARFAVVREPATWTMVQLDFE
jgi:hypothetical protein